MRKIRAAIVVLVSVFAVASLGAALIRSRDNRLLNYPELISEKALLLKGVMGAQSFLVAPNSLAGQALNLGAWHGHQSVMIDREWAGVPTVAFRVRAEESGFVAVEARAKGRRILLRLSSDPKQPSAVLTLDGDGKFLTRQTFPYELRKEWSRLKLKAEGNILSLIEDSRVVASHKIGSGGPWRVVFRGSGAAESFIDDISIREGDQKYTQSFSGRWPWLRFWQIAGACAAIFGLLFFLVSMNFAVYCAWLTPLAAAALLIAHEWSFAYRYPAQLELSNLPNRIESRADVLVRLSAWKPAAGKRVVLWLGTSQAWGAGASLGEKTSVARLSRLFPGIEFLNGAIPGAKAIDLLLPLSVVNRKTKPDLVVLTLGVNDTWNSNFANDLGELVKAAAKGSAVLLVSEASEADTTALNRSRAVMRGWPKEPGVIFFDLQKALERHRDSGFIWWDFVHFTDYGHSLTAKELSVALGNALQSQREASSSTRLEGEKRQR